jgi:hypothetical protein
LDYRLQKKQLSDWEKTKEFCKKHSPSHLTAEIRELIEGGQHQSVE